MYRLKSNGTYTESLNTLDDREDQNYKENKGATKPTGIQLSKLENIFERAEKGRREPPGTTAPVVIKQYIFYDGESRIYNDNNTFYIKKNMKIPKKLPQKEHGKEGRLFSSIHRHY